jgi:hypothetical protein
MQDYYVYGLHRPDTGQLFYIGYGRGNRAWRHQAQRQRGRSHKDNVLCRIIDTLGYPGVPVVMIRRDMARDAAIELEAALIHAIGRHPHGPLTNIMPGAINRSGINKSDTSRGGVAPGLIERLTDPAHQRDLAARAYLAWPDEQTERHQSVHWSNWWNGF